MSVSRAILALGPFAQFPAILCQQETITDDATLLRELVLRAADGSGLARCGSLRFLSGALDVKIARNEHEARSARLAGVSEDLPTFQSTGSTAHSAEVGALAFGSVRMIVVHIPQAAQRGGVWFDLFAATQMFTWFRVSSPIMLVLEPTVREDLHCTNRLRTTYPLLPGLVSCDRPEPTGTEKRSAAAFCVNWLAYNAAYVVNRNSSWQRNQRRALLTQTSVRFFPTSVAGLNFFSSAGGVSIITSLLSAFRTERAKKMIRSVFENALVEWLDMCRETGDRDVVALDVVRNCVAPACSALVAAYNETSAPAALALDAEIKLRSAAECIADGDLCRARAECLVDRDGDIEDDDEMDAKLSSTLVFSHVFGVCFSPVDRVLSDEKNEREYKSADILIHRGKQFTLLAPKSLLAVVRLLAEIMKMYSSNELDSDGDSIQSDADKKLEEEFLLSAPCSTKWAMFPDSRPTTLDDIWNGSSLAPTVDRGMLPPNFNVAAMLRVQKQHDDIRELNRRDTRVHTEQVHAAAVYTVMHGDKCHAAPPNGHLRVRYDARDRDATAEQLRSQLFANKKNVSLEDVGTALRTGETADIEDLVSDGLVANSALPACMLQFQQTLDLDGFYLENEDRKLYYRLLMSLGLPIPHEYIVRHMLKNSVRGVKKKRRTADTDGEPTSMLSLHMGDVGNNFPTMAVEAHKRAAEGYARRVQESGGTCDVESAYEKTTCAPSCATMQRPENNRCPMAWSNRRKLATLLVKAGVDRERAWMIASRDKSDAAASCALHLRAAHTATIDAVPPQSIANTVAIHKPFQFTHAAAKALLEIRESV